MRGLGRVYRPRDSRTGRLSRFWWIAFYVRGKEVRLSSKSVKKSDAVALLQGEIEKHRLVPGLVSKARVETVVDAYLRDAEMRGVRALDVLVRQARHIKEFCGHEKAMDIDSRRVYEFQQQIVLNGYAPASVNMAVSVFHAALKLAARHGLIAIVPVFPRRLREDNARQGFLEHADYLAILEELPEWAQHVFAFAYHTGWRKMEICTLTWNEVDLEGGMIHLDPTRSKNRKSRGLPLQGEVRRVIEARARLRRVGLKWVFHREGRFINAVVINEHFRQARDIAGKPATILHDTRRTFVRNMIRAGVPEAVVMKLSGHESRSIMERYNIVSNAELLEAAEKMNEYMERKAKETAEKVLPFRKKEKA